MTRYYRPRKKADLIRHLVTEHADVIRRTIEPGRWTVDALTELHDSIHRSRVVSEVES